MQIFVSGDIVFSSNGIGFETTGDVFDVGFFAGGGSSGSDQFLDNDTDLGVNKNYSISTSGGEAFNVEAMDFYASSDGGTNPTDDGTLTLTGVLGGEYSIHHYQDHWFSNRFLYQWRLVYGRFCHRWSCGLQSV